MEEKQQLSSPEQELPILENSKKRKLEYSQVNGQDEGLGSMSQRPPKRQRQIRVLSPEDQKKVCFCSCIFFIFFFGKSMSTWLGRDEERIRKIPFTKIFETSS